MRLMFRLYYQVENTQESRFKAFPFEINFQVVTYQSLTTKAKFLIKKVSI